VVTRAQAAYPGVTIEQFGAASSNKWFNDTIMKDFKRAEWTAGGRSRRHRQPA
jgi:hypothetical protein